MMFKCFLVTINTELKDSHVCNCVLILSMNMIIMGTDLFNMSCRMQWVQHRHAPSNVAEVAEAILCTFT